MIEFNNFDKKNEFRNWRIKKKLNKLINEWKINTFKKYHKKKGRKKFLKFSNENIKNSVTKIDTGTKK